MTLLIKNARIATGSDILHGDVLVDGEIIVRIDRDIPAGAATAIDAGGRYLLPGCVDVHTHFDLDLGAFRASDDFFTGSVAAACGGTTTVVDHMAFGPKGCRLGHQVGVYHGLARDAVVDYSFHGAIQHVDDCVLADMETLIGEGITSHKIYMTYGNKLEDPDVLRVLERARELGLVVCVHCENDAIIAYLTRRLLERGDGAPRFHPRSRPECCEAESVYRLLRLSEAAGDAPLYVVHLSTAMGLDAIRDARRRGRRNVFAETCPQYLLLDESRYDDDAEGLKYIMSPPLRSASDNGMLWEGLREGAIDVVATDHCPFTFAEQKQVGRGDFSRCPGGIPGVEARLALLFSEGFMKGRLTLQEVARLCCTRPSEIFGLYPKKGVLAPGSDADMVLFDPDIEWTLTHGRLHERVDYTPYEGWRLRGAPVMTVSRGEIIVRDGEFMGATGRGRFVRRTLPKI